MSDKLLIYRDTQEKKDFWNFPPDSIFEGTENLKLPTGDYTIKGFEKQFVIERKRNTGELSNNITEERFERELIRLEEFQWPFMVFDFDYKDIVNFPLGSGIPQWLHGKLKIKAAFFQSVIARYQIAFKTKIIFAGRNNGEKVARELFKMVAKYGKPTQ